MNRKSYGFSLIEIMISLTIASLITLLLYQSLDQSRRLIQRSEASLHAASLLPRAYNQLEKDITSIFVPYYFFYAQQAQKKEGAQDQKEQQKEKKLEPIKDIFVSTNQEKNLAMLTFFTTHSLSFLVHARPMQ